MDHSSPYVSFCFTTYKRKDYLKSTLESVMAQTFSNFEAIISDNDPEQSGKSVVEGMNEVLFTHGYNMTGTYLYSLIVNDQLIATKKMVFAN